MPQPKNKLYNTSFHKIMYFLNYLDEHSETDSIICYKKTGCLFVGQNQICGLLKWLLETSMKKIGDILFTILIIIVQL